ncbi:MAG: GGDEF domain-containing protein, partial [Campylobacterota bacterium]|nr:GGDEF domain-containing protein [Campylobacterota bacterium]
RVNDSHGHDVGDEVLIELSALIQHSIRSNDKLIRFGGEEFFTLLSNADIDIAVEIAEKFRLVIESKTHSSKDLDITASFGVVEYTQNESMESLIKRADILLYKAKHSGRNRVES